MEFWEEEKRRCLKGHKTSNDWIPGYYYFYLNYCPIPIVESKEEVQEDKRIRGERVKRFPKVWDGDYEYFNYLEQAEIEGEHGAILKTRGRGFSWKGGSMLDRNFFLIPDSKSYAVAFEKEYLTADGLLTKAWDIMDFINDNTAWTKRKTIDKDMHKRAGYHTLKDGKKIEKGYKSEIIGISLKDNPQRIRGKRGKLILYEEAGRFPQLLSAWQISRSSMEQGMITYGIQICFGTGGTADANFDGLEELFYYPGAYNVHTIPNIWDDGQENKTCGYFSPEYMNMEGYYDKDGNSDAQGAMAREMKERKKVAKEAKDRNAINRYMAEKPFKPSEAILRMEGVIYPVAELKSRLGYLEANDRIRNADFVGDIVVDEANGNMKWKENKDLVPIVDFPMRAGQSTNGCIVIFNPPYEDESNRPPVGMYIAGTDPYNQDKANTGSLGSTLVYDRVNKKIVAEYTGRPETGREYYENLRKLLLYYNCKTLYENQMKGLFDYFESKSCLYLLADEPTIIHDIIDDSRVSRKKGMHMTVGLKEHGEDMINTWLIQPREDEPELMNLHKMRSIPLLKELVAYNQDGNFDRHIALLMVMYYEAEIRKLKVIKSQDVKTILDDPFWKTDPFKRETEQSRIMQSFIQ